VEVDCDPPPHAARKPKAANMLPSNNRRIELLPARINRFTAMQQRGRQRQRCKSSSNSELLFGKNPARVKREKLYPVQRRKISAITKVILALQISVDL
jgi:hypothetical protein